MKQVEPVTRCVDGRSKTQKTLGGAVTLPFVFSHSASFFFSTHLRKATGLGSPF